MKSFMRLLSLVVVAAALTYGIGAWAHQGKFAPLQRGLHYTVEFADAQGLKADDPVQLRGVEIGRVAAVRLMENPARVAIDVAIDNSNTGLVSANSSAQIARAPLGSSDHERVLQIVNPPQYLASAAGATKAPPMPAGQTIRGLNSGMDLQAMKLDAALTQGSEAFADNAHRVLGQLQSVGDDVQSLASRPEVRDLIGRVQAFGEQLDAKGHEAAGQIHTNWTTLLAQADATIADLNAAAHSPEVQRLAAIVAQVGAKLDSLFAESAPRDPYRTGHFSSRSSSMF